MDLWWYEEMNMGGYKIPQTRCDIVLALFGMLVHIDILLDKAQTKIHSRTISCYNNNFSTVSANISIFTKTEHFGYTFLFYIYI